MIEWDDKLVQSCADIHPVQKPLNWREYPYPFIYGQVDNELFPMSEWRDCARQALGMRNFGTMVGDFGMNDDPMLVNYICSRSLPRRGIKARPEQILVTLGAQNALYLVAQLIVDAQKHVVIENPAYPDLRDILRQRTPHITELPVDDGGLVLDEDVLKQSDSVFITPSHQCPTTCTMPASRRRALLDLASQHDLLIIEDDYEFEMNFLEAATPALKSQDDEGRVIYVGSLSKSVFPGLRLGYLVAPEGLIARPGAPSSDFAASAGTCTAHARLSLWHWGITTRRSADCVGILLDEGLCCRQAMDEHGLFTQTASHFGGTSFWVNGPGWLDAGDLALRARDKGVLIEPGDVFLSARGTITELLSPVLFSHFNGSDREGVARLAAVIDEMKA